MTPETMNNARRMINVNPPRITSFKNNFTPLPIRSTSLNQEQSIHLRPLEHDKN
jgi:hypothetical protein